MYEREIKRLRSCMDEELWVMFAELGCYVAGGSITSLFTKKEINDLDIYFPSKKSMVIALANIFGCAEDVDEELIPEDKFFDIPAYKLLCGQYTEKSIMFGNPYKKEHPVQFIHFKYFDSPEAIFDTFDYTICMGAYDIKKDELVFHPSFMAHNSQRHLQFNTNTSYPLVSLFRVKKYEDKGYTISKAQLTRVILTCMQLELKSWEDVESHIGGMYGEDVLSVFDTDKEFNIDEVVEQLDNLVGNDKCKDMLTDFTTQTVDIEELLNSLLDGTITKNKPLGDPYVGRYFKWVNKTLEWSPTEPLQ